MSKAKNKENPNMARSKSVCRAGARRYAAQVSKAEFYLQTMKNELHVSGVRSISEILNSPEIKKHEELISKVIINNGCITLNFRYPYEIELNRIPTPLALMQWVHHLCQKNWMDSERICIFIEAVCANKGWKINKLHP